MSTLSLIVPLRDEEKRLPLYLPRLLEWCRQRGGELVLCDDGSRDHGLRDAVGFARDAGVSSKALTLPRLGKGAAIQAGIEAASGDILLTVDADLPLPTSDLDRILSRMEAGAQMCIGVRAAGRKRSGSSWTRQLLSFASIQVSRLLLGGIEDSQCGCKAWTAPIARRLCARRIVDGFAFDVEILLRARHLGLAIDTVGVDWTHRDGGSVRPVRDAIAFLRDLVRLFQARLIFFP